MRRYWQYLKYVLRHKWFVFVAGLKVGVPVWMLVLHDWDKFMPDEWFPYAKTFYKPNGEKQYNNSDDFAMAWMKHQKRNKHHWQYWLKENGLRIQARPYLVWDTGKTSWMRPLHNPLGFEDYTFEEVKDVTWVPDPMPDVFRREMLADWHGAGRAIKGKEANTLAWYTANRDKMILHDETRQWFDEQLGYTD